MACNTANVVIQQPDGKRHHIGDLGISCRTADDWYVDVYRPSLRKSFKVADHLPSREDAMKAAQEYLKAPYDPAGLR